MNGKESSITECSDIPSGIGMWFGSKKTFFGRDFMLRLHFGLYKPTFVQMHVSVCVLILNLTTDHIIMVFNRSLCPHNERY